MTQTKHFNTYKEGLDLEVLRQYCMEHGEERTFLRGETLEDAGEPAQWVAFVERGCFKYMVHNDEEGKDYCTGFAFEGEFVADFPYCLDGDASEVTIEAEEVVQETWLRAWGVHGRVTLTDAYVLRIARNCCVSMWRGQRTQVELTDEESAAVNEVTPQEEVEERENSEWLQSRLQRLPQAEREVWQMFYDEGLTVEEIAEARGTTVGTVRKTISNVRSTLRTELRRRFFDLRHLIMFILVGLVTGIAVASAINPNGVVRGAIEHVLGIPEDTTIYDNPEVWGSYRGDVDALYRHIAFDMHYPEEVKADSVQGRVILRFVVEKDGSLTNFEVLRTPDERISEEAIRVVRLTEPWIPAKNNGRDVRSRFCMPVTFRLNTP